MIIGIDLGTTNSLAACFKDGKAVMIPNRLMKNLTPSVVAVDEKAQILVGETAREYGLLHPEQTAEVFKRFMGSERQYDLGGHKFRAEDLSAMVLRSLKEDAESFLGEPVTEAVISVPAYFDDKRRRATKAAGELAGLKVERIISEPTAAAIAYGLYEKRCNTRFLVFDLGGGTFDVSILELAGPILEVRAVAGDNYLGGENFTRVLEKEFFQRNELDEEKLDRKTLAAVHEAAESCKKRFGREDPVEMCCRVGGEEKRLSLSLKEYGELCRPLLERIQKPLQRSISDAHVKLSDIDEVVLVGGATRMPVVRDFVVKLFHKFPDVSVHPDEVVALGAAIQGAMKSREKEVREMILTDVCAFTLGIEVVMERREGVYEPGHFCPIIERNTVIPASRTERFYTVYNNQDRIRISVYQGESRLTANNLLLGGLEIQVPKNRAGKEAVEVTYTYDINSILEVEVKVLSTGKIKKQIIKGKYNTMTDEEIRDRMEEFSYLKIPPRDQEENRLLLLQGEQCYEESTGELRERIEQRMRAFEAALDGRDRDQILEAGRRLRECLSRAGR
ncbi:MAG: molecular chaperone HscC [Enterocloster asparagiformis]|nr:molecular chaperone HscC [Enterocloster asparagiformis]